MFKRINWGFVITLIVSITGIFISLQANSIYKLQTMIAKNSEMPNIQVNERYECDGEGNAIETIIEISNIEGKLNNYDSEIISFLEGYYIDEEGKKYYFKIPMVGYYIVGIHTGDNLGLIESKYTSGNYSKIIEFRKTILEYLGNKQYENLYINVESYVRISYIDLLNEENSLYIKTNVLDTEILEKQNGKRYFALYKMLLEEECCVNIDVVEEIEVEDIIALAKEISNLETIDNCEKEKIMDNGIISWCNENQGFLSALLSVLALGISVLTMFMTYRLGRMPFIKKLAMIPKLNFSDGEFYINLKIINSGNATICIDYISISNNDNLIIGMISEPGLVTLKPYDYIDRKIVLFDDLENIENNQLDLNGHIVIRVIDVDGRIYKASKGFPVG